MSLSFTQKRTVVDEVSAAIRDARAGVLAEYRGLSVAQLSALRGDARQQGVWMKVVKNNLARRAIADTDFACLSGHFQGPVIFSTGEDAVAVAKVMAEFAKDNEQLVITVGVMNGELIDARMIGALAKLPGRDELLAKLAGTMRAPVQKFVGTLNAIPSQLVRTLAAVVQAKA
jgi:large subunit ribosomal protein L10